MIDLGEVKIRPYTMEDVPALFEAARESVKEIGPWLPWCHDAYSIEESRSYLSKQVPAFKRGDEFAFAIVASDGTYLGGCGLNQIDKTHKRANLGYWVRSSATRRGVATRTVQLIRDWGFEHTDLLRFELVVAVGNFASQGVARKAGAVFEGILHKRLLIHGVPHDATMFSFTREPNSL